MTPLSDQERQRIEAALLPVLGARYPGRAVTIEWDEPSDGHVDPEQGPEAERTDEA